MGTDQASKLRNGQEGVQEILERLGIAGDPNWVAVVLFARNLVSSMHVFSDEQKASLQADIFRQIGKGPLNHARFRHVVNSIEDALMRSPKVEDLRSQIANERQGFLSLYDEVSRVLADIQHTTEARETHIKRMGADTERDIVAAENRSEVLSRLRGMVTGMVAQARAEARSWQERAKQLEHTANFDPLLSELYSRRALDAELGQAHARSAASGAPLSLMFLDVDRFKLVNDTYGHQVGDGVLRVLAAIVSAHSMRFKGFAARFGGEELVVLCEGMDEQSTLAHAEDIRQDVSRCPFMPHLTGAPGGEPLHVTVSIGVAQIAAGQSVADLILAADQAMYAAKTQGRDRVIGHGGLVVPRPA